MAVIGIDLGTTNSCVAVCDGDAARVLTNRKGYTTTPSVVGIDGEGRHIVGQDALRQAVTNPADTIYAAKRLLGRAFDSEQVRRAQQTSAYAIVEGPAGKVAFSMRGEAVAAEAIAAILLQELRVVAEEHLQEKVSQAVVTVPAYFNELQRQAVRDAGTIAGLEVLQVLNEPTAAAIAYGHGRGLEKTIAVYDLGGGTFDVSVVRVSARGRFEVLATTGDAFLGGEDFDERLMRWLARGFEKEHGVQLEDDPMALQRLKQAAKEAKAELSERQETEIALPFIVSKGPQAPLHLKYSVTRDQLEALTRDLVERTQESCARALQLAGLEADAIDDVVLVGGMTRMPAVQRAVEAVFGKLPSKNVHPDEAVALGAALQGAAITGAIQGAVELQDVAAHPLGIALAGDGFQIMISPTMKIPCRVPSTFTTFRDGQERLRILVLQGHSARASENTLLKDFTLTGLRPAPAGEVEVEVVFEIDRDGLFSASARDLETGEATAVEIDQRSGFEREELAKMAEASAKFLAERRSESALRTHARGVEGLIEAVREHLSLARTRSLNATAAMVVQNAEATLEDAAQALTRGDAVELETQEMMLEDAKSMLQTLLG